ncbi:glycosyltransferase family 4 protein [Cupriavidus basilensis]|uniref:glycosyltransferase family 4 protein n=1 Tax=Cupriavidus basilensis TaxID=68895 RepID=UPI0007516D4B|nr:glycosyltransferase family 4 protein [Cupriavidus basilensis]
MAASVTIFHNVVWSRHKGAVLSALYSQSAASPIRYTMVQIAETEYYRVGFSDVDYSFHKYPMHQLYAGCYEDVPRWKMTARLTWEVIKARSELVVLPGYHRPEYWAMLLACIVTGKRRAVFCDSTGHDRPRRMVTSIPKRLFFSLCHGYFGFGERSREYLMSLGARPERIFTPCQAAAMPATYQPEQVVRQRLSHRADGKPVFLYVGRLSEEKGLDTLLVAFAGLRGQLPAATLRMVGTGPLAGTLRQMAASLGIEDAVELVGSKQDEELSQEYYRALCMVLPSYSEPWGLVVNEALSHGCPTVASDICGCVPELVLEGETGFAVPVRDAAALQAGMARAVAAFADTQATAERCLAVIRRFDPASAASNIARGCAAMLSEPDLRQHAGGVRT